MADEKDIEQSAVGTPVDGRMLLQMQIDRLSQGLQKRANPFFDPSLMKMAAGFAKPTKTGSFFESLGYAGEEYANEYEKQRERQDAEQKLALELFSKQYELQQEQSGQEFLDKVLTGKTGKPSGGVLPDGSPAPVGGSAVDLALSGGMNITDDVILAAKRARVPKATIEVLEKMQENQRKRTETEQKEYAVINTPVPFVNEAVPHTLIQERVINGMKQKALSMKANGASDADVQKMFYDYYANEGLVGTSTDKSGARAIETPKEKEQRIQLQGKQKESDIKVNEEAIGNLESARSGAGAILTNGKAVYDIANNPKTAGTFGILQNPGFASAIGDLASETIRIGGVSVGIPSIESAARKMFKTQDEIDAATAVGSNLAQLELAFSKAFKGQGQVSDYERQIVEKIGPSLKDSAKVASLKSESIMARAEYDIAMAKEYRKYQKETGGTVRDFLDDPKSAAVKSGYEGKLSTIMSKYGLKADEAGKEKPRGKLESFIRSKATPQEGGEIT